MVVVASVVVVGSSVVVVSAMVVVVASVVVVAAVVVVVGADGSGLISFIEYWPVRRVPSSTIDTPHDTRSVPSGTGGVATLTRVQVSMAGSCWTSVQYVQPSAVWRNSVTELRALVDR